MRRLKQPMEAFSGAGLILPSGFWRTRRDMATEKLQVIVDQIKELSLLEASHLVKLMEETFGVSAAAAAVAAAPAAGPAAPVVEEKDEFDVILTGMAGSGKKKGLHKNGGA